MKRLFILLLLGALVFNAAWAQREITLDHIWKDYTFLPERIPGFNFLNDGQHYTRLENNQIVQYDLRSGEQTEILLNGDELKGIDKIAGYQFTADEKQIILDSDRESIYRHSYRANFQVYDRASNKLMPVFEPGKKTRLAALSPDGSKVAFVYENNLYYQTLSSGKVTQVTTDGEVNKIINGATDWVYEEEFGDDHGFFWSPDSKQIAYYRFDESEVPEFTMTNYHDGMYPDYVTFKYPKVGEKNSDLSIHIYDLAATTAKQVASTGKEWEYFPRIKWTQTPGELCVFHMNRHQNKLQLELATFAGDSRTLLTEENRYYIDIHDNLTFLDGGKYFIWTSEQDGWNHIYLYNMNGKLERQLTEGKWEVTNFYGLDEEKGTLFFQAAMESPLRREVYSMPLSGNQKPRKLAGEIGTNSAQFSGNYDYFVLTFSTINRPPSYTVVDRQGKRIRLIENNAALQTIQERYQTSEVDFFDFPIDDDGLRLNGYMIKPHNFNPNIKYPLLMYVYGGPGSQQALDSWRGQNYWWFQMLAQQGFIVACVDNRGTGARGEEFKKMTYLELGKYETEDQIAAARYLGGQPYIDGQRMGIFGWSYGGYMSSLALLKGNDVFKAAIAVAPVTNWKWYDSIYTERYMRTTAENEDGYADNSPVYFADRLKGKYLLVHGMGDDNVHFQHTAEMANALISANKQFDTYFYPNRNHGIYGGTTRLHLYTKMTEFLMDELKGEVQRRNPGPAKPNRLMVNPMQKSRG